MTRPVVSGPQSAIAPPESTTCAPPAAERSLLPAGFYHLTLIATLLSVAEVRLRLLPWLPSSSLYELIVIPTILAMITEMVVRPRLAARLGIYRQNRPLVWYVGYAGFASVVGLVRSSDSLQAFHDLFPAFALYALVLVTVDSRARLIGLLATSLAGAIPALGLALLQHATGGFYLIAPSESTEGKLDLVGEATLNAPTGLLTHPNSLAHYLLPIVIFLAMGAWRGFGKAPRPSLGLVLAAALLVLDSTNAKGVYAWLAAGLVFLALPRPFERWRLWIALIAPLVGIILLISLSLHFFLQGDTKYVTVIDRLELWFSAIDIIRSDSFVSVLGSGGPQLHSMRSVGFEYANAHNTWISQALTYGVPALAFYLAAFGNAFRSLAQRISSGRGPTRAIALATMASLMALVGENFFEPADRGSTVQAHLFLLFAVAACVTAPERASGGPTRPRSG
jgi:hypothetical protein